MKAEPRVWAAYRRYNEWLDKQDAATVKAARQLLSRRGILALTKALEARNARWARGRCAPRFRGKLSA